MARLLLLRWFGFGKTVFRRLAREVLQPTQVVVHLPGASATSTSGSEFLEFPAWTKAKWLCNMFDESDDDGVIIISIIIVIIMFIIIIIIVIIYVLFVWLQKAWRFSSWNLGSRVTRPLVKTQSPYPQETSTNPTTKIGSKMGGEFTYQPKSDNMGVDPRLSAKLAKGEVERAAPTDLAKR